MKSNRIILTVILLLLVFTVSGFVATAEETAQSKLALDMVVVIDESGSMSARQNSMNDQYGYRHDAAASLVGLCDAEKSRVALLPFSSDVITSIDGVNELKEVDIQKNGSCTKTV